MRNLRKLAILLAVIAVFAFAAVALAQTATPSITVRDQAVQNGSVMVERVVAAEDGWVEIHADANGTPGAEVGHAAVKAGTTDSLVVPINEAVATPRMWAMLHIDAGVKGKWEFPGPDVPVKLPNGDIVMAPFNVTGISAAAGTVTPEAGATVTATSEALATPVATTEALTTTATATPEATSAAAAAAAQVTATATLTATAEATATPLATATTEVTPTTAATVEATPTTAAEVATATPEATTAAAAAAPVATSTAAPSTLPTTGGSSNSTLVVLLLGLGGLSLLAGIGLNLARRPR